MTWTMIGDDLPHRPGILRSSWPARWLHIAALVWCNAHGTDGQLPGYVLPVVAAGAPTPAEDLAAELVAVGLWSVTDDSWQIDFTDQLPADEVQQRRAKAAERKKRSRLHTEGDHRMCLPSYCRHVTRDTTVTGRGTATVTDTLPTPPTPSPTKGEGGGDRARPARGRPDPTDDTDGRPHLPNLGSTCGCPEPRYTVTGECVRCGGDRPNA